MTVSLKVARPQTALKPSETLEFSQPSGTCLRNLHHHTQDFPEPSGTCPPEPTPAYAGTCRNLPELASSTYTSTCRHEETTPAFQNLPELAPETSETFRNTSTHRNPPEPLGTFLQNLHPHTPKPSGTCGTCCRTHRNLSGPKTQSAYTVGETQKHSIP